MPELSEDVLAPDVVVRRAPTTEASIRPGDVGQPPLVGAGDGAVWARAGIGSAGVDIGHGSVNIVVRSGTVLVDAHGGAGLVIVLQGAVEISTGGATVGTVEAGRAVTFDTTGRVGEPDPVDAAELAHDPFISMNLVLDALGGAPVHLPVDAAAVDAGRSGVLPPIGFTGIDVETDRKRGRGLFGGRSK